MQGKQAEVQGLASPWQRSLFFGLCQSIIRNQSNRRKLEQQQVQCKQQQQCSAVVRQNALNRKRSEQGSRTVDSDSTTTEVCARKQAISACAQLLDARCIMSHGRRIPLRATLYYYILCIYFQSCDSIRIVCYVVQYSYAFAFAQRNGHATCNPRIGVAVTKLCVCSKRCVAFVVCDVPIANRRTEHVVAIIESACS